MYWVEMCNMHPRHKKKCNRRLGLRTNTCSTYSHLTFGRLFRLQVTWLLPVRMYMCTYYAHPTTSFWAVFIRWNIISGVQCQHQYIVSFLFFGILNTFFLIYMQQLAHPPRAYIYFYEIVCWICSMRGLDVLRMPKVCHSQCMVFSISLLSQASMTPSLSILSCSVNSSKFRDDCM